MKRFSFSSRVVGFYKFEHRFIKESNHTGFVKFVGANRLQLLSHPLMTPREGHHEYQLPPDIHLYENQLVHLSVGPKQHRVDEIDRRTGFAKSYSYYYQAHAAEVLDFEPPKPRIDTDEFLYRLTRNWNNASADLLDETVALQILSCPPRFVPVGGVGSQTLVCGSVKSPLTSLKKTIQSSLPVECFNTNDTFYMGILEKPQDHNYITRLIQNRSAREVSYNSMTLRKLSGNPLPMTIPTIIDNAKCRGKAWSFDPDVCEYVLLAHFLNPVIDTQTTERLAQSMREVQEELSPKFLSYGIAVDRHAVGRLAQAFCRLDFRSSLDAQSIGRTVGRIQSIYKTYWEALVDTFDTGEDAYREPRAKEVTIYEDLPNSARHILGIIVRSYKESKKPVPIEHLHNELRTRYEPTTIDNMLEKLNLAGYVIPSPDGKGLIPVILEDEPDYNSDS